MQKPTEENVYRQLENHDASIGAAEVQATSQSTARQSTPVKAADKNSDAYTKLHEVRTLLRGIFPKNSEGTELLFTRVDELVKMFKPTGGEPEPEFTPEDDEPEDEPEYKHGYVEVGDVDKGDSWATQPLKV